MIRLDTPPDAIDKVYAKSLFELAEAKGGRALLEELSGELDELVELIRQNPKLEELIASRIVASEAKSASLRKIFDGRVSEHVMYLMLLLNKKGRASRFVRVAVAFDEMVQEQFGKVEVDVYTRMPIPEDQLAHLKAQLQSALGREPVLYAYTDETMLGGIRVRVGDKLVDASFTTRVRAIRERLTDFGIASVRERAESMYQD